MDKQRNEVCGIDKRFLIATILSRDGNKGLLAR